MHEEFQIVPQIEQVMHQIINSESTAKKTNYKLKQNLTLCAKTFVEADE